MSRATEWLANAPQGLRDLIDRATWHWRVRWDAEDYVEDEAFGPDGDGRRVTTDVEEVEAVSSLLRQSDNSVTTLLLGSPPGPRHMLAIDIDVPAWLIPSSTEGHGHFYADIQCTEADLWVFLDAAARIGLVEEGYVAACKSRGMTSLRAPWVRKGEERPPGTPVAEEWAG